MKNLLTVLVTGSILYSCNNPNSNSLKKETEPAVKTEGNPSTSTPEVITQNAANNQEKNKEEVKESSSVSIKQIVEGYLPLKNALTQDDASTASKEAKKLYSVLKKADISKLSADVKDILESAAENAEHISENSRDIAHQREHLLSLSNDMADLIKEMGTGGLKLYQNFCPMYNNGKGGTWISESEEIINPYEGQKMINCGSVKKAF
ncbi:DUF3347 domain-containing protein [Chryseobacterium sp. Tr-659]|uniref:DUF3347 domain-containing protein n=1 Tax=Chryseobacterium sp. Tr-659 TaxID=2608340 RepID=UPI00141E6844|nr:DUF3347 domain-containing protein [Chryseobacterium sp. Tr-659]NIF05071.1 DUF3347 domain-containing protein [Chryseobacterium sp. Tr-659]